MKGLSTNENSSDLDVGRRPELKSEEFSFVDNPFTRYRGVKTYSHHTKCFTCSEHDSVGADSSESIELYEIMWL